MNIEEEVEEEEEEEEMRRKDLIPELISSPHPGSV